MITIDTIAGKQISDSRGNPTLSVEVRLSDGSKGVFDVPSGASTGVHEAHELRDDGTPQGGVARALELIENEVTALLQGANPFDQAEIDRKLIECDGTSAKDRLGGNTLIGVSIACAKAAAASRGVEVWEYLHASFFDQVPPSFPRLYANLINGGKHASTGLAFQEYHVVPKTQNIEEASALIADIQEKLGTIVAERFGTVARGDEGGYALPVEDVRIPLALLDEAARAIGVRDAVDMALDVAASSFWNGERYVVGGAVYDEASMIELFKTLSASGGMLSIEDPFHEEAFDSFAHLRAGLPGVLVVGDDLTTTSDERLEKALEQGSVDALIIKPNQIGTLTETIETMKLARERGIRCIVSHRSGETLDAFIADLAYASGAFGIKLGARGPSEREAKYARLLAIFKKQKAHHISL